MQSAPALVEPEQLAQPDPDEPSHARELALHHAAHDPSFGPFFYMRHDTGYTGYMGPVLHTARGARASSPAWSLVLLHRPLLVHLVHVLQHLGRRGVEHFGPVLLCFFITVVTG
jgi:hypothetical protein